MTHTLRLAAHNALLLPDSSPYTVFGTPPAIIPAESTRITVSFPKPHTLRLKTNNLSPAITVTSYQAETICQAITDHLTHTLKRASGVVLEWKKSPKNDEVFPAHFAHMHLAALRACPDYDKWVAVQRMRPTARLLQVA